MIMFRETSGISKFCESQLLKWVIIQDEIAPYHDDHFKLVRYLGPSIDIGPVMMEKIIEENGQGFHRSTDQALTHDEWEWEE